MFLSIFLTFLAISIFLIIIGYATKEKIYSMIGFGFLTVLGLLTIIPESLEIPMGTITTYNYSCGCCQNGIFTFTQRYQCEGIPYTCDHYDLDETNCILAGCTYNNETTLCSGTPTPCSELGIAYCEYYGCQGSYISNCDNETTVIQSETQNTQYTNLTGFWAHFVGLWITLLGIAGFAIQLVELRRGNPES